MLSVDSGATRHDLDLWRAYVQPMDGLGHTRYVVLNSGIDFREHAYGTNSLQIPKLPDHAVIDLREPAGPRWPGRIVDAGFFDESWR